MEFYEKIKNTIHYLLILSILMVSGNDGSGDKSVMTEDPPNFLLLISDNHYYKHLGSYGDPIVQTPHIDQLAAEGVRFTNAYAAPTCTPARGALLAGQDIWRLGEGANLWSTLSDTIPLYTDVLEEAGYLVGHENKGWGPGNYEAQGRKRNPAGYTFEDFQAFLNQQEKTQSPWSYWMSSYNPHRPFDYGAGIASGMNPEQVEVPPYLPDVPEVRADICDYYYQIQQFDDEVGEAIALLKEKKQLSNTVIIVAADNGWMMPRGLANLYDFGTRVPLIISWPRKFTPGRVVHDFVKLNDLAPTILELTNSKVPEQVTANSLVPILESDPEGQILDNRNFVVLGRERHAIARQDGLGYPARAIRTNEYLYIHNIEPERWPAGDPPLFGDIDAHMLQYKSPTKEYMMAHKDDPDVRPLYEKAFLKRPEEELYDLNRDPYQMQNVAGDPDYADIKSQLKGTLNDYLHKTDDPRVLGKPVAWDHQPYYKEEDWVGKPRKEAQEKFNLKEEYPYNH